VTGVQTCALPILGESDAWSHGRAAESLAALQHLHYCIGIGNLRASQQAFDHFGQDASFVIRLQVGQEKVGRGVFENFGNVHGCRTTLRNGGKYVTFQLTRKANPWADDKQATNPKVGGRLRGLDTYVLDRCVWDIICLDVS